MPLPTATAELDLTGHGTSMVAASRSFLLAVLCVYVIHGGEDNVNGYPAFGRATSVEWEWIWPIFLRNVLATWIIAGFWDWFLYFSPVAPSLHRFKLNPVYPSFSQISHDAFVTTTASLCGSALECWICYMCATNRFPMQMTLNEPGSYLKTVLWALTITHWRIPHFWLIHRAMHPWKIKGVPRSLDPGRFLYRHVHALHHKSYNPTAFSGTNMHPVEARLYYSAALIAIPFGVHPTVWLGCIIDCAVGAWLGHDGFQWPGSGDYFHQLHHKHFDCNYGAMHVPIDKWLGTYAGDGASVKKIWRASGHKAGAEANETAVHTMSRSASKVE